MSDNHTTHRPPCEFCGRPTRGQPYYSAALAREAPGGFSACDPRCAELHIRRVLHSRGELRIFGVGRYAQ